MFEIAAMVHSKQDLDVVRIVEDNGANNVIAEYDGKRCTAIYNSFVGLYYVDDEYGVIGPAEHGPIKGKMQRGDDAGEPTRHNNRERGR